jgi:cytidylate kinase
VNGASVVVAIDGPAGSGKSTTARLVAERLGYLYLDTGAMYRALTWKVLMSGADARDAQAVGRIASSTTIEIRRDSSGPRVFVDETDVTDQIRGGPVSREVSWVARVPEVRRILVARQRALAAEGGVVVEGRDIGTVVFPDAPVKVFLDASLEERARRRRAELLAGGPAPEVEEIARELRERDALDTERDLSPLRRAPDALSIDTTGMSIEEQVEAVVRRVQDTVSRGGRN